MITSGTIGLRRLGAARRPLSAVYRRRWNRGLASSSRLASWATIDPEKVSGEKPHQVYNIVNGEWVLPASSEVIVDPLNGSPFLRLPDTKESELQPFVDSLRACPKSGLHNPIKNPARYVMYGDVSAKAAQMLRDPEVEHFFARLIQRVAPKSYVQAKGEVNICRVFLENFSGDQVRFLARSFGVPGDHQGQTSQGFRWPYGPVCLISPFNFPMEIPLLQLMGALYMGNKVTFKGDSRVNVVMEQTLRMLHACGLPLHDVDMLHCQGPVMQSLLTQAQPRMTQFTGSSKVAEMLARELSGRVKLEDAGFDWKLLGPDVKEVDYVAWVCDQDAYAYSGQKCSAQSILFMHQNWVQAGLQDKLKALAGRRQLSDHTVGPVLTVTNQTYLQHIDALLKIKGAYVAWGGKLLEGHSIPPCYGSWHPTAVYVPIEEMLRDEATFALATREIFGPFQIITSYTDDQLPLVLEAMERMHNHLTAAVVSNDVLFRQKVLAHTINGTTYCGLRARTTGAPQNHWFGPAGDPRGAGIGTPEAIKLVWSCHREIIVDEGPLPQGWTTPGPT